MEEATPKEETPKKPLKAKRPIFIPSLDGRLLVSTEKEIEFEWHPGLFKSQSQKSIASLHAAAQQKLSVKKILEISIKSPDDLGVKLSAFNLMIETVKHKRKFSVECAFQASKVFEGEKKSPFLDLLNARSIDAKRDPRLKKSGKLVKFRFFDEDWDLQPTTAFYDWLYINALHKKPELVEQIIQYEAFSDIAFNPKKSKNCQAYAVALYVSLYKRGMLKDDVLKDKEKYLEVINTGRVSNAHEDTTIQGKLL